MCKRLCGCGGGCGLRAVTTAGKQAIAAERRPPRHLETPPAAPGHCFRSNRRKVEEACGVVRRDALPRLSYRRRRRRPLLLNPLSVYPRRKKSGERLWWYLGLSCYAVVAPCVAVRMIGGGGGGGTADAAAVVVHSGAGATGGGDGGGRGGRRISPPCVLVPQRRRRRRR